MRKTSQSWEAIRHYITIIQQTKKNTIIHLLIVPVSIVTSASIPWDIFAIPNTSILIIENILYNKTDYVDVDSYIDYPGPVIASFFKTLHIINNLNINGIFYFRSTEALKVEDINRVKRALVFNQPRFADNPSKNKVKIDQLLQLFPTEYTGLYACKKT